MAARGRRSRLLVIGLDGATPQLAFERFRPALPALTSLAADAMFGELESTVPATTLPSWPALVTGFDPGQLGIYSSRQRPDHTYGPALPITSRALPAEAVWDYLGRLDERSILIGVPPSYPPRPINGLVVSCSLTPPDAEVFTAPAELSAHIRSAVGRYRFDLRGAPGEAPEIVLERAAALTRQRFALLRTLLTSEDWRFAMVVDPTLDRLQHLYWEDLDAVQRHYALIDAELGETVALLEPADSVLVVSDHGGRAARGGFAVNDWLMHEGYLRLRETPTAELLPFERSAVDWPQTQAWAEGGSTVRIALNVQGREPEGAVEPRRYEMVRNEIKRRLEGLAGPDGKTMGNRAHKPEEIYAATRRTAPDLVATLGGMAWRAVTTVGHNELFLPPSASAAGVHADHGLFLMRWPGHGPNGRRQGIRLLDIFPTLLTALGLPIPADRLGHGLVG